MRNTSSMSKIHVFNLQIIIDKIKVDSVIIRIISISTKTVYSNLQISVKYKIKLCLN